MSLMFGVTAAAGVGGEPPPADSQAYDVTAGYLAGDGVFQHGYQSGVIGAITPNVPVKTSTVYGVQHITIVGISDVLKIELSGIVPQDFFDSVDMTGIFNDGGAVRTVTYLSANATYSTLLDVSTLWDWTTPVTDFMVPGNIYDVVFNWTNP